MEKIHLKILKELFVFFQVEFTGKSEAVHQVT